MTDKGVEEVRCRIRRPAAAAALVPDLRVVSAGPLRTGSASLVVAGLFGGGRPILVVG